MWFILSKLFWVVFAPVNLLVGLLAVSVAWMIWRRRSIAARLVAACMAAITLALGILPIGHLLLLPLEDRFAKPAPAPARVAGIIVLGGAVRPDMTAMRGEVALNRAAERMTEAVALSRRYPEARIVFTGANAALLPTGNTEAQVARRFFGEMGIDSDRLVYEDRSRNTRENALFTRELIGPAAGETWLLVTSARHMPRAIGCFRKVGWNVVPWPVDYETAPQLLFDIDLDMLSNLQDLNDAAHEWVGLLAYWLLGYSPALFPGP
jgi:uncharacterized SAM-binding protein YcdF (DUF218 family)